MPRRKVQKEPEINSDDELSASGPEVSDDDMMSEDGLPEHEVMRVQGKGLKYNAVKCENSGRFLTAME